MDELKKAYVDWKAKIDKNMERIQFVESQMSESAELERDYFAEWEALWDEFDDLWNSVDTRWNSIIEST